MNALESWVFLQILWWPWKSIALWLIFDYYFQIKMSHNVGKNVLLNCQATPQFYHQHCYHHHHHHRQPLGGAGVQGLLEHFVGNGGCWWSLISTNSGPEERGRTQKSRCWRWWGSDGVGLGELNKLWCLYLIDPKSDPLVTRVAPMFFVFLKSIEEFMLFRF